MTLTTSLLGVFLLFYGFLRDYLSFGICRLVMYIMLCITYLLLAISRPYESDNLQEKFLDHDYLVTVYFSKNFDFKIFKSIFGYSKWDPESVYSSMKFSF